MKLIFKNVKGNITFLIRRLGYGFERKDGKTGEEVFRRRLRTSEYPKFHIYAFKEGDNLIVNLHLDQKKPVYAGAPAHGGEYDGEIVEQEGERIKTSIEKIIRNS